jgi:nucleotidyltransferase/DNA polymerase involved in DNA repair
MKPKVEKTRRLGDLVSVGPATVKDLKLLGVNTVEDLAQRNARELYQELCRKTGVTHDPCCEDIFSAAIAQAKNPRLPAAQCRWWYYSRLRKEGG